MSRIDLGLDAHGRALPAVFQSGGKAQTSSCDVAAFFEKNHRDVMRDIRDLIGSDVRCERKFALTSRQVRQPNGGMRTEPSYHMDRDGFTLLAMGFQGKKALAFKLAYIEAFNQMEARIRGESFAVSIDTEENERRWLNKINLALRVHGRQAARELWDISPLPKPTSHAIASDQTIEDGIACLAWLLAFKTENGPAIGELVAATKVSAAAIGALSPLGLRVDLEAWDGFLVVADAHPVLQAIFARSPWSTGWRKALLAIPGAQPSGCNLFRRLKVTGVAVPLHITEEPHHGS